MSIQCIILLIILFVLSISTCRSNNFEEFGHDFQAYPSYLESFIEGNNIQDEIIHYFNNIKKVENKVKLIDVSSFGANGDGKTDDTRAFEQAWKEEKLKREDEQVFEVKKRSNVKVKGHLLCIRFLVPVLHLLKQIKSKVVFL
ncbi:polygalacturonase-2 isoform X1 [Capsicum annuum]|uniref:polygalacturonase-2 isoform X1 n=1 Tax=Capsicum annuum TaxID=4072 RepID=UPI001FB0E363|nr:polygalacturonase-2 isoform X1 [Capsicum annuum]